MHSTTEQPHQPNAGQVSVPASTEQWEGRTGSLSIILRGLGTQQVLIKCTMKGGGELTRLVGAILAVTVVIVDLIERNGGRAVQAGERLGLIVEVMV